MCNTSSSSSSSSPSSSSLSLRSLSTDSPTHPCWRGSHSSEKYFFWQKWSSEQFSTNYCLTSFASECDIYYCLGRFTSKCEYFWRKLLSEQFYKTTWCESQSICCQTQWPRSACAPPSVFGQVISPSPGHQGGDGDGGALCHPCFRRLNILKGVWNSDFLPLYTEGQIPPETFKLSYTRQDLI